MTNDKPGQLILQRRYWDQFARGTKNTEYRRHRGQFTIRTFWPGRTVLVAYSYSWRQQGMPHLDAIVRSFDVKQAFGAFLADMREVYPDMQPGDEAALIGLNILAVHKGAGRLLANERKL